MKYIIFFLLIAMCSCTTQRYCKPPKGSRDYAKQQWIKQRSDGYWVVTTLHRFKPMSEKVFECKPDSIQLASL